MHLKGSVGKGIMMSDVKAMGKWYCSMSVAEAGDGT